LIPPINPRRVHFVVIAICLSSFAAWPTLCGFHIGGSALFFSISSALILPEACGSRIHHSTHKALPRRGKTARNQDMEIFCAHGSPGIPSGRLSSCGTSPAEFTSASGADSPEGGEILRPSIGSKLVCCAAHFAASPFNGLLVLYS